MIEGTGRHGRRHKELLDDLKDNGRYWTFERGSTRSLCASAIYSKFEPNKFNVQIYHGT